MENKVPELKHVIGKELKAQLFANHRRVVKFLAICFVPFLYGFFCIWAFWNPFIHVERIPMAIVNNDANLSLKEKQPSLSSNSMIDTINKNLNYYPYQYNTTIDNYLFSFTNETSAGTIPISVTNNVVPHLPTYNNQENAVHIKKDDVNIKLNYLSGSQTNFSPENKYWVQLRIPQNYSEHLLKLFIQLDLSGQKSSKFSLAELNSNLRWIINNQINIWGTYQQNFLIGYFAHEFTNLRQALIQDFFPSLIYPMLYPVLAQYSTISSSQGTLGNVSWQTFEDFFTNIEVNNIFSSSSPLTPAEKIIKANLSVFRIFSLTEGKQTIFNNKDVISQQEFFVNVNGLNDRITTLLNIIDLPTTTQGYQDNQYGIGLGELFLFIAIWVGSLTQTFVYDRRGRSLHSKWYQYYLSKYLLMVGTAMIQVTILMASLLILGFDKIGPSYALLWLWMYFMIFVFISIIFGLWMLFRDEMLGRICAVVYLILNLAAGWGTFPSFMQNGFMNAISYITPFRYGLHNMGIIIYGLPNPIVGVGIGPYQTEILQNFGILLIWLAIFIPIGLGAVYLKFLRFHYGTIKISNILSVIRTNSQLLADQNKTAKNRLLSLRTLSVHERKQIKAIIKAQPLNKQKIAKKKKKNPKQREK